MFVSAWHRGRPTFRVLLDAPWLFWTSSTRSMVRRIASQVHQQVSRLMRANYIRKEPAWYNAVLDNPPLTLPPKLPAPRTAYDVKHVKSTKLRPHSTRPLPIYYVEDDIRRQFFKDHPFEAFRPATLTEGDRIEAAHPISREKWTRLRQRGRNPTPSIVFSRQWRLRPALLCETMSPQPSSATSVTFRFLRDQR